uniref:DNA mismatch repair proteins mutS family domain-containing protein n=1 Tax=viral metagenome TaxID=1070528 RepID=A0A6C0HAI4_9ZZZZ
MALLKEYLELTKKYLREYGEKTVVLMQVGAFFEVYGLQDKTTGNVFGSKITDFSIVCDLNIADKKICVGADSVIMAGFSHYMIDKYIKKLQDHGYTIVVYTQDEQNKNTTRSLSGIYSPGTYFDPVLSSQITNNTTCIWINTVDTYCFNHIGNFDSLGVSKNNINERKDGMSLRSDNTKVYVGMANIDVITGKTSIFEFNETYLLSPTTFDELERFISIYKPSECILIGNIGEKEMEHVISYANIESKSIHKICLNDDQDDTVMKEKIRRTLNCEKQIYQKELLTKFYEISDFDAFYQNFYENTIATQAFCFLLDFIYQHNPYLVNKISDPKFENCSDRLILANHSLKQLNIVDDHNYTGKYSSVEKMLNVCITSMGKRRFSNRLLNPTTNVDDLNNEYNITEHMLGVGEKYEFLKNKLVVIKDISKLVRQIVMKKVSPKMLIQFYKNLQITDADLFHPIFTNDAVLIKYLQDKIPEFSNISTYCKRICEFIVSRLDTSLCDEIESFSNFELNFIKKGIDIELDERNETLLESNDKLEAIRSFLNSSISKFEKSGKTSASDYVKIHETEKNSFSLVATKRRCNILKESFLKPTTVNLKYVSSFDGQTKTFDFKTELFFSTQTASNDAITSTVIQELCKNISTIKIQMKDLITRIYLEILTKMEQYLNEINTIIEFVTLLDVVYAKTVIAKKYNYCRPVITDGDPSSKSFVNARGLRHCLIEHLQQNELYVANDIVLGNDSVNGILLYGTNAVGKTSFIRALGIAIVMAQAGLYVPCSSFEYQPYKYIFTRILGNDNIFKGLSTFAVEMSELRTILRLADEKSIVLGDELCSGTESISATSIFVAGVKQLEEKNTSFIFATHLHEIVRYDEIHDLKTVLLKHMSVIYDRENDKLIYDRKLKDGPGDNMYGLEVCKSLNLPETFLELAHNIRMKYHPISGSILSLKTSHYNSKKIVGICEMCKEQMGQEVHHLQHQRAANEKGVIQEENETPFHKNRVANLMSLCEKCHDKIHKQSETKVKHKKVKTSKGIELF